LDASKYEKTHATEAQPKRRIEQKITKRTKTGKSFAKNAEFSEIALQRRNGFDGKGTAEGD